MTRKIKGFLLACVVVIMAVVSSACGEKGGVAGSMSISKTSVSLDVGMKTKLFAEFTPSDPEADISDVTIQWSSAKSQIATVDNDGTIVAVSTGTTIVTAKYGKAKATCEVKVLGSAQKETEVLEISKINVSVRENKMNVDLTKELGYLFTAGDALVGISEEDGTAIPFTVANDVATVYWTGDVGLHTWYFITNKCKIQAEVCNATHLISRLSDFGPLSEEWEEATKGNETNSLIYENATKDWYIAMDADLVLNMEATFKDTYTFGRRYNSKDGKRAIFQGTFDGRGHSIDGLRTRQGFICNLGQHGVIQNLAITGSRNGEGINYQESSGGVLGAYGLGTVKNCFIDAWLYYEDGWASAMYKDTDREHPLTVIDCLVMSEVKGGVTWGPASLGYRIPGIFTTMGDVKINLTNSYGISSYFTRVDGAREKDPDIVFKSFQAFLESGAFSRFGGLWEIGENNIFFAGKVVFSLK